MYTPLHTHTHTHTHIHIYTYIYIYTYTHARAHTHTHHVGDMFWVYWRKSNFQVYICNSVYFLKVCTLDDMTPISIMIVYDPIIVLYFFPIGVIDVSQSGSDLPDQSNIIKAIYVSRDHLQNFYVIFKCLTNMHSFMN